MNDISITSSSSLPREYSSYSRLISIPSLSTLQLVVNRCGSMKEVEKIVIKIKDNEYGMRDIEALLRLHYLKDVKRRVEAEIKWFMLPTKMISTAPVLDATLIQGFSSLLLDGVDNHCVNPHNPTDPFSIVLYSDLANLAGKRWMNIAVINAFVSLINAAQFANKVFTSSVLQDVPDDTLSTIVDTWKTHNIRSCTIILNVKKTESGDKTLVANRGEFGTHWSCVFINLQTKACIYSDSLAWPPPTNLNDSLQRLLNSLERVFHYRFDLCNSTIAHKHSNSTSCKPDCMGLPYQGKNMDVCGLACLVSAMMLSGSSNLYQKKGSWVTKLDRFDTYLRRYFICCYMKGSIDFELFHNAESEKENLAPLDPAIEEVSDTDEDKLFDSDKTEGSDDVEKERSDSVKEEVSVINQASTSDLRNDGSLDENGHANHVDVASLGSDIFRVGKKFTTFYLLKEAMNKFESENGVQLRIVGCCTLKTAEKKAPKRVKIANPLLEYYYVNVCCKFSGTPVERERKRKTSSMRRSCPFYIGISLSSDGQSLEVTKFVNHHNNHMISKELIKHLPRQRALTDTEKEFAKKALLLKGNKKMIQQKFLAQGKEVTLKDLSNLQQQCKVGKGNEIKNLVEDLSSRSGSVVELVVNQENEFGALFYQDVYMKEMYESYPELIMVDATFKLLDSRYPVFLIMVIDGNGMSEIVGVFILSAETKEMIESAVKLFQKHNPAYTETRVIMSDKDFTEREVFARLFPSAYLLICLFHTLRTFKREVTCDKMGLTSGQRNRCLEILQAITYSKSPEEYEKNVALLMNSPFISVREYFQSNWEAIKDQWVLCYKDEVLNLGEGTNNRLESTFQKIKSVCSKFGSLRQFFEQFFTVLDSLRNERNNQFFMALTRKSNSITSKEDVLFSELVTPYALNFILKEKNLSLKCSYQVTASSDENTYHLEANGKSYSCTTETCSCNYVKKLALPCHHIFYLWRYLNASLYDKKGISKRWTRLNYVKSCSARSHDVQEAPVANSDAVECGITFLHKENEETILSQGQKLKKMRQLYEEIVSLGCEGGMPVFNSRYNELKTLLTRWRNKEDVPLLEPPTSDDNGNVQNNSSNDAVEDTHESACGESTTIDDIKLPPTMLKRGRPKGAEVTVIGLPKKKVKAGSVTAFHKLQPKEKDRILLECFVSSLMSNEAIKGQRLITSEDITKDLQTIPDIIKDHEQVDINRIQKFFQPDAWSQVLGLVSMKVQQPFVCTVCDDCIASDATGVSCIRCLRRTHSTCVFTKGNTKKRKNFVCAACKVKFSS